MMKQMFIVALLAMAALVGCKGDKKTDPAVAGSAVESVDVPAGSIAYVQMDSLLAKYDMAIELQAAFKVKYDKAERDLNVRSNALQKEAMDYQDKAQKGLLLRSQAAEIEATLTKKQQALVSQRDKALNELQEEESVMNNRIFYAITDYLKELNADYRYSMIITTTTSGPVLAANPAFDITKSVLAELNRRYAAEKKK